MLGRDAPRCHEDFFGLVISRWVENVAILGRCAALSRWHEDFLWFPDSLSVVFYYDMWRCLDVMRGLFALAR